MRCALLAGGMMLIFCADGLNVAFVTSADETPSPKKDKIQTRTVTLAISGMT